MELYSRGREQEWNRNCPRVLALLTYHVIGMNKGIEALRVLKRANVRLSVWADRAICLPHEIQPDVRMVDAADRTGTTEWLEKIKGSFDCLFLPVLSFSLVSQLVQFNDDHPFVRLVFWSLLSGKRVAALSAGADPYSKTWADQRLDRGSPLLKQDLRRRIEVLRGYGITLLEMDQIQEWLVGDARYRKKVITSEDIQSLAREKKHRLIVSKDTIVTPLAADLAAERRIRIERKQGEDFR